MKITKTIRKEETVEVDVTLPYFSKDSDTYYAILSGAMALKIAFIEFPSLEPTARISTCFPASSAYGNQEITAKEFEYVYETAADYLHTKFELMRDTIRERKNEVFDNVTVNGEGDE